MLCVAGYLQRHGLTYGHLPVASSDEVKLDVNEDISGRARYHLVKAHGTSISFLNFAYSHNQNTFHSANGC